MQTQQTQEKPWDDSVKRLLRSNPRPFLALAFGKNKVEDQQWLLRKLSEMQDLLYDTPYYQHILQQSLEKGLQQGLEQGHEQGLEEGREELRQVVRGIVLKRFPKTGATGQKASCSAGRSGSLKAVDH